jgi:hypothetical protein
MERVSKVRLSRPRDPTFVKVHDGLDTTVALELVHVDFVLDTDAGLPDEHLRAGHGLGAAD